jgi:hypothetical protein
MSAELLYSEIFEQFGETKTKEEKINLLRKNGDPRFKFFLQLMLNPTVEFDVVLPLKYRHAVEPAGLNFAYLDTEMNKMYRFIKNHHMRPEGFTAEKTTSQLQVILEALHKDEAAIFAQLIQKKFKVKGLTPALVKEAFPDLDIGI